MNNGLPTRPGESPENMDANGPAGAHALGMPDAELPPPLFLATACRGIALSCGEAGFLNDVADAMQFEMMD